MTYWTPSHIHAFRVSCSRGCFTPVMRAPGEDAQETRARLDKGRCNHCGDRVSVEALWRYSDGSIPGLR
jgi:hypothetical protein